MYTLQVCINRVQEKYQTCPCCRESSFTTMLDKKTRGIVLGLKVRCEMSEIGCAWIGELGDLHKHLEQNCLYTEKECQHGCGGRYPRHLLQIHEQDECLKRSTDAKLEALSSQMMTKFLNMEKEIASLRKQYNDDITKLQLECKELKENNKRHKNDNRDLLQQLEFTCQELKGKCILCIKMRIITEVSLHLLQKQNENNNNSPFSCLNGCYRYCRCLLISSFHVS